MSSTVLQRYHGFVLDIPMSDGIEEFVSAILRTGERSGVRLLIIQVGFERRVGGTGRGVVFCLLVCMYYTIL